MLFHEDGKSSMPNKLASARLAPLWGPSFPDILTCNVQTRYSCWSGYSRPSCSLVPHTLVKSGPQLMQPLSRFGASSLCSTPSFAVLAVSKAASLLRSSFRSFLYPGGMTFGGVRFSVVGMRWLKLILDQSSTLSYIMPLLWLRAGAAMAGLHRSSNAPLSMASTARWWLLLVLRCSLMSCN